jgi:hypothetical protein
MLTVMVTGAYNAVSRALVSLDIAEMKDVKPGDATKKSKL